MALDQKLLKQVRDKDPKVRRKAIVALADCRDAAALEVLDNAARTDADEKLRALAARAQAHLKEHVDRSEKVAANPEAYKDDPALKPRISDKDKARAKAAMDEALSYYIAKDNAKATKCLIKAVVANPLLKEDSYFLSMAGNILNVPQDDAMQVLFDNTKRNDYIVSSKQAVIQRKKNEHYASTNELTWMAVWFDLGVFAAVTAVITFLLPLVFVQMIGRTIEYQSTLTFEQRQEESMLIPADMIAFNDAVSTVGIPIFLAVALGTAAATAVSMLLQGGAIHLIATKLLGGTGTMRYMMCQILPYYSMTSLVLFVWLCIAMGIIAVGAGIIGLVCLAPMALASLVIVFKVAGKIGAAYDFGAGKGCMALVISSIALALVSSPVTMIIQNAFSSWMAQAMFSL